MKFQRTLQDGNGRTVEVTVIIDEPGMPTMEAAIVRLAAKARDRRSKKATALDGVVRVFVKEVG